MFRQCSSESWHDGIALVVVEKRRKLIAGNGLSGQHPLHLVTPFLTEDSELRLQLHALSDNLQVQCVSHANDAAHEGDVFRVHRHFFDERLIDLQLMNRIFSERAQCRVSSAEIIDRYGDPEFCELAKHGVRLLGVPHDHALGDLHRQIVRD